MAGVRIDTPITHSRPLSYPIGNRWPEVDGQKKPRSNRGL